MIEIDGEEDFRDVMVWYGELLEENGERKYEGDRMTTYDV